MQRKDFCAIDLQFDSHGVLASCKNPRTFSQFQPRLADLPVDIPLLTRSPTRLYTFMIIRPDFSKLNSNDETVRTDNVQKDL